MFHQIFSRTRNWDLIIQWCHHFMTHALGPVLGLEVVEWQLDSVHLLRQKRAHPRDITIGMFYPSLSKKSVMRCSLPSTTGDGKLNSCNSCTNGKARRMQWYFLLTNDRLTEGVPSQFQVPYRSIPHFGHIDIGCHDQWLSNGWSMQYPNCGA